LPGLITHYICGQATIDALGALETSGARKLAGTLRKNRQLFNVGAQGPDVFFYYLPCLYKRRLFGLGSRMHNKNISEFFAVYIRLTENLPKDKRAGAVAYLAGYLTHYALDCAAHPYIYYKSGFKRKGDGVRKIRYSVNHRRFETNIDVLMLKLTSSERPMDKKLWQLLHVPYKTATAAAGVLSQTVSEVYGARMNHRQAYMAMYQMAALNRLIQSKNGRRKRAMELIEGATVRENVVSSLIHDQEITDGIDYLNLSHSDWNVPWENKNPRDEAFTELFAGAVAKAAEMIQALWAYFENKMTLDELLAVLGNNSFSTGVDASSKTEFVYSDVVYKRA